MPAAPAAAARADELAAHGRIAVRIRIGEHLERGGQ